MEAHRRLPALLCINMYRHVTEETDTQRQTEITGGSELCPSDCAMQEWPELKDAAPLIGCPCRWWHDEIIEPGGGLVVLQLLAALVLVLGA